MIKQIIFYILFCIYKARKIIFYIDKTFLDIIANPTLQYGIRVREEKRKNKQNHTKLRKRKNPREEIKET